MNISPADVKLFYKLHYPLLIYVNKKFKILKGLSSPNDLKKFTLEEISRIREKLYNHPELIDSFVMENPSHFSPEELKIIRSWKNFVRGHFLIFRYLKNYTVFLSIDEKIPKAYGVLALQTPFEEMFGSHLPVLINAVLLPFKGKIIYDGILFSYPVILGGNMYRSFNDAYQYAKMQFGIITSLPFSERKIKQSDTDKLKFYLRSKRNRNIYAEEIQKLIKKNKRLLILYHQEMGKIHSRKYRKQLREIGLSNGWFAILEGVIIAGGISRDDIGRIIQNIVPPKKRKFVYVFHL